LVTTPVFSVNDVCVFESMELILELLSESDFNRKRGGMFTREQAFKDICSAIEEHTRGFSLDHAARVGMLSGRMAMRISSLAPLASDIRFCAMLHDIGKMFLWPELLNKPGPLTPEEYETVKLHTIFALWPLQGSNAPLVSLAREIAEYHHERWDGTGYPRKLRAAEIPSAARVVAIADAYSAITEGRPYSPARSHAEAMRIIMEAAGEQFDPFMVEIFCKGMKNGWFIGEYPEEGLIVRTG